MSRHTAGTLNRQKMNRIKAIVTAKFMARRSEADKEVLWDRCKTSIGQKCKTLRAAHRISNS